MGAKLSKKKKGYCLGAGKDGESTETTEVEQKETENQEGQKDAAEPKGEKTPIDQSQNNGLSEEPKDRKSFAEITTGEATKDESNQDQNPELKPSTEEKDQAKEKKEHEGKSAASEKECDKEKGKSEDKAKTECEVKDILVVVADKPTQESKLVKENEGSDFKQSNSSETKQSAPAQEEVTVKKVSEPVTKVEAEQPKGAPAPVGTEDHVSEKASEVPTQANKSAVEPEKLKKVPKKVAPSAPESVTIAPVSEPVAEAVMSQPVIKIEVIEPEVVESAFSKPVQLIEKSKPEAAAVPEKVDSALPNSDPTSVPEPVAPATKEPELAVKSEPSSLPEPTVEPTLPGVVPEIKIETPVPEQPTANPEQNVLPEGDPEPVPCPASEKMNESKQKKQTSEPLPPKSTEVPDETADTQKHTENQESIGCCDHGEGAATIQASTTEADSIKRPSEISAPEASVMQNGPSEVSAEDDHAEAYPISRKLKVEDKGEQKEAAEATGGLDKQSTQQENKVVTEDCKTPIDILVTSKNENDPKETHDATQHCNSEDKTENHDLSAGEVKNENKPPAPEILEKHGVGNGLPIKEEIKVNLENKCDNDLHDIKEHSGSQEIQVCNE